MPSNRVQAIERIDFDTSGLNASYQALGPGLDEACFLIEIFNDSDTDVDMSLDGVVDHFRIESGATLSLATQTNASPPGLVALFAKNQIIYVKGAGAGTGSIYVSGLFT